jgi:hypothetical protein
MSALTVNYGINFQIEQITKKIFEGNDKSIISRVQIYSCKI